MSIEKISQAKAEIADSAAYKTLLSFFDENSFVSVDNLAKSADTYAEVAAGCGTVSGIQVYAFAQNSDFCGGAMSKAQAKKLKKIYDLALKTGCPVVGFYDSKGGRIDEGNALLAGYGEVLNSVGSLSGVVPQISVVLGSCLGAGALNAVSADFVIMTKEAQLSLDTTGENCSAAYNAENGTVSVVADNESDAVRKAQELICYLPQNNIVEAFEFDYAEPDQEGCFAHRSVDAGSIFKLSKDYGKNSRTIFARIEGKTVGVVNTTGKSLESDDAAKIAKFVRFCDAFSIPVVTFVNSEGFTELKSAAKVSSAYSEATTVKISIVTGKAVGALYIALAGTGAEADMVYALPEAVISPVNPEAAALIAIPEKMNVSVGEQKQVAKTYADENLSAENAAECGYVDDVITAEELRYYIARSLSMLSGKRVETLSKKHSTI